MSLDAFEARLQFIKLLKTLNASQASIVKVVSFAIKYGPRCGEDLWTCVVDEVDKASLNARINILYFLDGLIEASSQVEGVPYVGLIEGSLPTVVEKVVPNTSKGYINLKSTRDILRSWATQRLLNPAIVQDVLDSLDAQTFTGGSGTPAPGIEEEKPSGPAATAGAAGGSEDTPGSNGSKRKRESMKRSDVLLRIEEDRERQKRLREKRWILPIPAPGSEVNPADVEFDLMWDALEAAPKLDDDDRERMRNDLAAAGLARDQRAYAY